jgi:hypothetical protein
MEEFMTKSIMTVAATLSILSLGSLVSAQAGGATSAPSRYNNADQGGTAYRASASYPITEFSASSAHHTPKK